MLNHYRIIRFSVPLLITVLFTWSCTDLEETPYDLVTPGNFYKTEAELTAAVVPVYNGLNQTQWGDYMFLQDVSSDAIVVPTRGGDWDDGGTWRALQLHSWDATLGFVGGGWGNTFGAIAKANSTLDALAMAEQTDLVKTYVGETKILRALYYWWLIDLYGDVPLVTSSENDPDNPPSSNCLAPWQKSQYWGNLVFPSNSITLFRELIVRCKGDFKFLEESSWVPGVRL